MALVYSAVLLLTLESVVEFHAVKHPRLQGSDQVREGVADKFVIDYFHCRFSGIQGLISLIPFVFIRGDEFSQTKS